MPTSYSFCVINLIDKDVFSTRFPCEYTEEQLNFSKIVHFGHETISIELFKKW